MDGIDCFALLAPRILKRKTCDAGRGFFGDDLERLHHARHNFMLNARVLALCIFPHNDQVYARIASGNARQIADGAEIAKQLKVLA